MAERPLLLLITGLPCTGKTTIGRDVARRLGLPLFSKDQIKERLFERLGWSDRAWSRKASLAAFDLLHDAAAELLGAGRSVALDGNFDVELEATRYAALREATPFDLAQLFLTASVDAIVARFEARARHPGHVDQVMVDELAAAARAGRIRPLPLPGRLVAVDTTSFDGVDAADLARRLRA